MGTGRFSGGKSVSNRYGRSSGNIAKLVGKKGKGLFERIPNLNEAIRLVNPNYQDYWKIHGGSGEEYNKWAKNCAIATTAGALQIMGYDVEAMPRDSLIWRGFDSVFAYDWSNKSNFIAPSNCMSWAGTNPLAQIGSGVVKFPHTVDGVVKLIDKTMEKWGKGSVASIKVKWKRSKSGHEMVVYRDSYRTYILDFQTHSIYTGVDGIKQYLDGRIMPGSTGLYRLDNQRLKQTSKDADKVIKRRK